MYAILSILCLVLLGYSCGEKDMEPVTGPAWSLPDGAFDGIDADTIIIGRLWVTPYPIPIKPDATWPEVLLTLEHLGSDAVVIDDITLEGDPQFSFGEGIYSQCAGDLDCASDPFNFSDWACCGRDGCGGGGTLGFNFIYNPPALESEPASLVIHTSDPTSPTFRVPIIIDHDARYEPAPTMYRYSEFDMPRIWVRPNPIRLSSKPDGETSTTEFCLDGDESPVITRMKLVGQGLSITRAETNDGTPIPLPPEYDGSLSVYMELEHTSEGLGPVDGVLIIGFLSNWNEEMALAVPIMVR